MSTVSSTVATPAIAKHLPGGITNTNNTNNVPIINNTINTSSEKKEDKKESGGHLAGRWLSFGLEGIIHHHMLTSPLYQLTYLTTLAAGAAFGLYKAAVQREKTSSGFEQRATTFAKSGLGDKAIMVAELAIQGPLAMAGAESVKLTNNMTAGGLVAGAWGFSLGSDLAAWAYNSIAPKKA